MSLNRWVFKWRLKVRMFSHSRMSAGREFQVDAAATTIPIALAASDFPFRLLVDAVTHVLSVFRVCKVP